MTARSGSAVAQHLSRNKNLGTSSTSEASWSGGGAHASAESWLTHGPAVDVGCLFIFNPKEQLCRWNHWTASCSLVPRRQVIDQDRERRSIDEGERERCLVRLERANMKGVQKGVGLSVWKLLCVIFNGFRTSGGSSRAITAISESFLTFSEVSWSLFYSTAVDWRPVQGGRVLLHPVCTEPGSNGPHNTVEVPLLFSSILNGWDNGWIYTVPFTSSSDKVLSNAKFIGWNTESE